MRATSIFLILCMACAMIFIRKSAQAQLQHKWWYFGNKAAVEFYSGAQPKAHTKGVMNMLEGSASISDPQTGQLLFYSDGIKVFDRRDSVMQNGIGLSGNQSASTSALIAPYPGKPKQYFLFTMPSNPAVLARYSIVDMNLNNGFGGVISSSKNSILSTILVNDRMTAVMHANKQDYWILIQNDTNWNIHAFLVDTNGVSSTPVISSVSPIAAATGHYGCLRVSPNGKKLVATAGNRDNLMLFDFNDTTGVVSKQRSVTDKVNLDLIYGAEFSSDSKLLYVTVRRSIIGPSVLQFDALAADSTALINSQTLVGSSSQGILGQLQLAPDQKIYIACSGQRRLAAITDPNQAGTACQYADTALVLTTGSYGRYGLPPMMAGLSVFGQTSIQVEVACAGHYSIVSPLDSNGIDSIHYNFGDLASGAANYSTHMTDSHNYQLPGNYVITAVIFSKISGSSQIDTIQRTVSIGQLAAVDLGLDRTLCRMDSIEAKVIGFKPYSVQWMDSSSASKLQLSQSGMYWAEVTNQCGTHRDSVNITLVDTLQPMLGNDTLLCTGDSILLQFQDSSTKTLIWSDGDSQSVRWVNTSGTWWLEASNVCGSTRDSIEITGTHFPPVDLGSDTVVCPGSMLVLSALVTTPGPVTYTWNSGHKSHGVVVNGPGWKWVDVAHICGNARDSLLVIEYNQVVDLGPDTVLCSGDSIYLDAQDTLSTYLWSTGAQHAAIWAQPPGTFWVQKNNACGGRTDTIVLNEQLLPAVNLGNDTLLVNGDTIWLNAGNPGSNYSWQDGSTDSTFQVLQPGLYFVSVSNYCGSISDTILVEDGGDPSGIYSTSGTHQLQIYPVPLIDGWLTVYSTSGLQSIRVWSISGALVREYEVMEDRVRLNLSELATGAYTLEVKTGQNESSFHRIVR